MLMYIFISFMHYIFSDHIYNLLPDSWIIIKEYFNLALLMSLLIAFSRFFVRYMFNDDIGLRLNTKIKFIMLLALIFTSIIMIDTLSLITVVYLISLIYFVSILISYAYLSLKRVKP